MSDALADQLGALTISLNRIVPIVLIILGTFGNVMNILIFTRRSLRTNSCGYYFLYSSLNNLFILYVALLTRLLSSGWDIDPSETSSVLCKLRIFFVYIALCLAQWLIVLASVDRYLSSCRSVAYRQLSNVSVARKAVVCLVTLVTLAHFHVLIWWSSALVGSAVICNIFIDAYDLAFTVFYLLFTCLLPPLFMLIFGLKTILNVRKLRTQVAPQGNNARNERLRSKDRQMITMLLVQVLLNFICTAPFTAINLYSTINDNIETSDVNPSAIAVYDFCSNVFRLMNYCDPVVGFFIYTLIGRTFRIEMKRICGRFLVAIGLFQCCSENMRRNLFEQDQSLTVNQSMSIVRARAAAEATKITNHPNPNQSNKHNNNIEPISDVHDD